MSSRFLTQLYHLFIFGLRFKVFFYYFVNQCLALGARAVFIGRPVLWGLGAAGEEGVHHVMELLKAEFELAMALSGCNKLSVSGS
jgi:hypothetical protein